MRTFLFFLFSILIGYLTKNIWFELNPWYYKIAFLTIIIVIPFVLYSLAAEVALKIGWFGGILTMIIITILDNYFTNAMELCIISKCNRGFWDFSAFNLSYDIFNLPWYTYLVSGIMGAVTGVIGDRQRQIEKEKEQKAMLLGVFLLAGQFLGMAIPELTPIISKVTPIVTTVMTVEIATKTGSIAVVESSKVAEKNIINKTEPVISSIAEKGLENLLKVKYSKFSYIKDGKTKIIDIPNFKKYSVYEAELPINLQIAPDKVQFCHGANSFSEQLRINPKLMEMLKITNKKMLKRDIQYFENNKSEILNAQNKMLEATKNNDYVNQAKWLKELRHITKKITFIKTPKGKPFKILNVNEILKEQLKNTSNPNSNSQGRILGYIWHHTEDNALQLVQKDVHEFNNHIGGNSICGGNIR